MNWTKHGRFFSLSETDSNDWRCSHTQLPIVDDTNPDYWRIYYSSRNKQGMSLPCTVDIQAGDPNVILGQNIRPLLNLGESGSFDEHGVMPTAIIHLGDTFYLYYIGLSRRSDVPYQNAIGLAISEDGGDHYIKYHRQPLFDTNAIDPIFTGTLNILRAGDCWHGYYMSCTEWKQINGQLEPRYRLHYASSENGLDWLRSGLVVIDYQNEEEGGIVAASVIAFQQRFHMWFCYRQDRDFRTNKNNSYRIGYATSDDAINWLRRDQEAGINISETGWDSRMITYPNVIRYRNQLYMFYNGNGFGQSGIGYAICNLDQLN